MVRGWFQHFRSEWIALLVTAVILGWPLTKLTAWLADWQSEADEPLFDYQLFADRVATWSGRAIILGIVLAVVGIVIATLRYNRCEQGQHCRVCADRAISLSHQVEAWVP